MKQAYLFRELNGKFYVTEEVLEYIRRLQFRLVKAGPVFEGTYCDVCEKKVGPKRMYVFNDEESLFSPTFCSRQCARKSFGLEGKVHLNGFKIERTI
jgi:hypothetical protein